MLTLQHLPRQCANVTLLPGCLLRVEGGSGAGKTLLLEMIVGKQPCPLGAVLFDNQETRGHKEFFGDTTYLPEQQNDLVLRWTVAKRLRYWAKKTGSEGALLPVQRYFKLEPWLNVPQKQISMGWRQRVRLARLMLHPVTIWLLDRPLLYLDDEGKKMAETLIASRCQQNGIVLFTHDGETQLNPHGTIELP